MLRLAPLVLLGVSSPVFAASYTVDTSGSGDFTSIQDAIDAAAAGDTITVGAGTYSEAIDFSGKEVTITSSSGAGSTTIDAWGSATFAVTFDDHEGSGAVLEGFTIANSGQQGVLVDQAEPILRDLVFSGLGSGSVDGGALSLSTGSPTVEDCTFSSNSGALGGHVYMEDLSSPTFDGCSFSDGSAADGGAIYMDDGTVIFIVDSTFDGNSATDDGGALYAGGFAELTLTDVDVRVRWPRSVGQDRPESKVDLFLFT